MATNYNLKFKGAINASFKFITFSLDDLTRKVRKSDGVLYIQDIRITDNNEAINTIETALKPTLPVSGTNVFIDADYFIMPDGSVKCTSYYQSDSEIKMHLNRVRTFFGF